MPQPETSEEVQRHLTDFHAQLRVLRQQSRQALVEATIEQLARSRTVHEQAAVSPDESRTLHTSNPDTAPAEQRRGWWKLKSKFKQKGSQ